MSAYHAMLSHFPVALWLSAALVMLWRAASSARLAVVAGQALPLLLGWATLTGLITFVVGLLVWPFEALSASPLGRNHLLLASWTITFWIVVLALVLRAGAGLWQGPWRVVMAALALIGIALLSLTGALGGHLIGNPTMVGDILRHLGWEIYTSFYVPNLMLVAMIAVAISLPLIALHWRRKS
jgi:hypothetical protein